MALREIRKKGDEVLYKPCKEVKVFDEKLAKKIKEELENM